MTPLRTQNRCHLAAKFVAIFVYSVRRASGVRDGVCRLRGLDGSVVGWRDREGLEDTLRQGRAHELGRQRVQLARSPRASEQPAAILHAKYRAPVYDAVASFRGRRGYGGHTQDVAAVDCLPSIVF